MVDVANRRCEADGCHKAPAFNYPAESRRRFCADHKLEGMVNLRKKRARSDIELQIAAAGAHPSQVVEEYMDDEQQGAYRYDEAYQAVAQQQMAAAAAVATASNGQTGQYGAPNVHHDGQVQPSGLDHQVAESMAQLGYVGQSVFNNMHMLPHSMQQDLVNAVASGNSDLVQAATQAATQRFMAMAQAQQVGSQDAHDASSFPQASSYPQQHLTPEQMMLAHSGGPGDQDMMHLSVPEHHMASMAATLQPDMHHQKQDQALTAEQILAQYGTLPDQHHDLSAQHVLASQHMHMQQGSNTGQQA
ncbi:hypothetical protein CVIRNUC_006905 [Coccomyxa viridis]|uniref:SBP-type domain-containing protein n=1 Tax=Coccomyxa viridis TaxID=1274662 RepID=A0AAV1I8M7_9CHLO|nr:hypothetical protein CVIRNUC_006905 [Coccomyxa viridis]